MSADNLPDNGCPLNPQCLTCSIRPDCYYNLRDRMTKRAILQEKGRTAHDMMLWQSQGVKRSYSEAATR